MALLDDAIAGAQGVKGVATGAQHVPFDYTKIDPEFHNGEHLDNPDGGPTQNIDAKGGPNAASGAGEIEVIHFGRVYIDVDGKFAHDEYDDIANIDMAEVIGGRAGMHRAALMRETMLQAGYLHAIQWAMDEASKGPPGNQKDGVQMVDQLLGMVGDLFGGDAAGQLQANTLDLNPLITQCNTVGVRLNQSRISYFHLHQAGIDLHDLRAKHRAFLRSQNKIEQAPANKPPALLGGLPLIGDALKNIPVVGDILKWGDKVMGCSFQLVGRLTIEMHLKMESSINAAVREMSLDAIRDRRAPVFYPWWKYPPPEPKDDGDGDDGDPDDEGMKIDFVKEAQKLAKPVTTDIDNAVKDYTSLFTRPDQTTPGDAYIDMAFFLDPNGSPLSRSETMGSFGANALARVVGGGEGEMTSFSLPDIVVKIATYIFQLVSEFVRAVYKKLLVLGQNFFNASELAEAGRTHLIKSLTDWPLKEFKLDQYINMVDQEIPSLSGGDPVRISSRALFENVRDKLIAQLGFMDAAVAWAMKSFYDLLSKARGELTGPKTRSMEAYLALIPTLHATMFRNLLLPFWEAMQNAVKEGLGEVLGPVLDELGASGFMGDFYEVVDTAEQVMARAQEVQAFLGDSSGRGLDDIGKAENLFRDTTDANPEQAFGNQGGSVGKANPFGKRVTKVAASEIDQAQRDAVASDLKWDPDAAANEDGGTEPPPPMPPAQPGNGGTP